MDQPVISPAIVGKALYSAIRECATTLRADFYNSVQASYDASIAKSPSSTQTSVLKDILENAQIGLEEGMPICQDTGSVWVCLEVGEECTLPGNVFSQVHNAVRAAYEEGHLRMSMLKDALLDRVNTHDNNPAFYEVKFVPGKSVRMHVLLKGGGSDNASRVVMLPPSAGWDGIKAEVLSCVKEKAANACPPLLVGVGVGATFDKVAGLAKHALLRKVGSKPSDARLEEMEDELLQAINDTEIGPGALGGSPTAVAVHIETAPCHIAALPLAINMGCCAMRSASITLVDEDGNILKDPMADTWMAH